MRSCDISVKVKVYRERGNNYYITLIIFAENNILLINNEGEKSLHLHRESLKCDD